MPREGGYGGADYGEGGAHEDDPTQDELSRQRRQRHDEIPDARYLVHGAADHVVVQRRMRATSPTANASGSMGSAYTRLPTGNDGSMDPDTMV